MLDAPQLRVIFERARPRLGGYYRDELVRFAGARCYDDLLEPARDASNLQEAVVRLLQSNLRAIPIFGTAFVAGVVEHLPASSALSITGIPEERTAPRAGARVAVAAIAAAALLLAGAAGEHLLGSSQTAPQPTAAPPIGKAPAQPPRRPQKHGAVSIRTLAQRASAPLTPAAVPQPAAAASPAVVQPLAAAPKPRRRPRRPALPARRLVITITPAPAAPAPQPSPTAIGVADMPRAYSDATPLPQPSVLPISVPVQSIRLPVPKPTPTPRHRSWLGRTIMHLDPFKPGGRSE